MKYLYSTQSTKDTTNNKMNESFNNNTGCLRHGDETIMEIAVQYGREDSLPEFIFKHMFKDANLNKQKTSIIICT